MLSCVTTTVKSNTYSYLDIPQAFQTQMLQRKHLSVGAYEGFPKLGVPFCGSPCEDYSILGSILGSPYFTKLPYREKLSSWFRVQGFGGKFLLGKPYYVDTLESLGRIHASGPLNRKARKPEI